MMNTLIACGITVLFSVWIYRLKNTIEDLQTHVLAMPQPNDVHGGHVHKEPVHHQAMAPSPRRPAPMTATLSAPPSGANTHHADDPVVRRGSDGIPVWTISCD